jgi:hypothetical protein
VRIKCIVDDANDSSRRIRSKNVISIPFFPLKFVFPSVFMHTETETPGQPDRTSQQDTYAISWTLMNAQFPEIQIGFFDGNARSRPMVCKIFTKTINFKINYRGVYTNVADIGQ